jgi:glycosyltransferase involved in cell wall biosynthesis
MKKLLIITPHLSTGGLPQYLLAKVERLLDCLDVWVVEHTMASDKYVVQRNPLRQILSPGHLVTLGPDKAELLKVVAELRPDIIHWEEIPELFCEPAIARAIYRPDRDYVLVETTHTSSFDPRDKVFRPDKFWFVSEFSRRQYEGLGVPCDVVQYPVEPRQRPGRFAALRRIGLDPESRHVLNVGLFTPGKNQGAAFEIARKMAQHDIFFHFIGNQAPNFEPYWSKLEAPQNCFVWGERPDVDDFYAACDLFLFTSLAELNPLVLKEAMAWGLPVLMRDLPTYCGAYSEGPKLRFLTGVIERDAEAVYEMTQ